MGPNPQFLADLVTFTEEILNGKLHFLCSRYILRSELIDEQLTDKHFQPDLWSGFMLIFRGRR